MHAPRLGTVAGPRDPRAAHDREAYGAGDHQHTLSDGEDFTEGYRSLRLGKVVGEPTSGWIIFTSNVPLLDGSTLRIPFTRVTDANGREMELSPRPVDTLIIRPLGESHRGADRQLDAAVASLLDALPKR